MRVENTRREFLKRSAVAIAGAGSLGALPARASYLGANERPVFGFIGAGIRYNDLLNAALRHSKCAAVCDVDSHQLDNGLRGVNYHYNQTGLSAPHVMGCEDYRRVLDRQDIDAVVIATPDHWHAKIAIEAMRAGKDVYCEKPLTLTIAEGKQITDTIRATGRVFQVGTQQRSGNQFQTAAALMRAGRIGNPKRLTVGIGNSPTSGPLPECSPPSTLNWNRWLGPAPWTPYVSAEKDPNPEPGYGSSFPFSRAHVHFRWWYDYAGGKLTDWGAHHVDIAMWALGKSDGTIGPYTIEPISYEHPVDFVDGYATTTDQFDVATSFNIRVTFADGVELDIVNYSEELKFDNGIMFQGDKGRYFVNRGKLTGKPSEELAENPLPTSAFEELYPGLTPSSDEDNHGVRNNNHMLHFIDCMKSRATPISDAASHCRHLTVCHLANLSMRLGRKLTFDPATERFVDDAQADTFLAREPRKGFETEG